MTENPLKTELLRLMEVKQENDFGVGPTVCRWCGAWFRHPSNDPVKPFPGHNLDCFAVHYLGQKAD